MLGKQVVIVGGASGVGLALSMKMHALGWHPIIVDRSEPSTEASGSDAGSFDFIQMDLTYLDETVFRELANNPNVGALVITAGFGRVARFGDLRCSEIRNLLEVNSVAPLEIIRLFWEKISGDNPFYCGVMSSIAGMVSSPFFSVYAASKAALWRFCESANAELAASGKNNRITCVAPGHISGTAFDGGEKRADGLEGFSSELLDRIFNSESLWIYDPDGVYEGVLARYSADPELFGEQSASYKIESGRMNGGRKPVVGYCSGTFDLFHVGHLNLLRSARSQCDELVVGIHPDAKHKGKTVFIPLEERKAIVSACQYVSRVIDAPREDSDAWPEVQYGKLFVGSDYLGTERFERYERELGAKGVEIVYFPYTKGTSSTQLRAKISGQ